MHSAILCINQNITAADGKERNTRFNGNCIVSFRVGKDFLSDNKLKTFGKWNRRKVTGTLFQDIQNLTNRLNLYNQSFDEEKGVIVSNYQTGLIPVLNYKIEF